MCMLSAVHTVELWRFIGTCNFICIFTVYCNLNCIFKMHLSVCAWVWELADAFSAIFLSCVHACIHLKYVDRQKSSTMYHQSIQCNKNTFLKSYVFYPLKVKTQIYVQKLIQIDWLTSGGFAGQMVGICTHTFQAVSVSTTKNTKACFQLWLYVAGIQFGKEWMVEGGVWESEG